MRLMYAVYMYLEPGTHLTNFIVCGAVHKGQFTVAWVGAMQTDNEGEWEDFLLLMFISWSQSSESSGRRRFNCCDCSRMFLTVCKSDTAQQHCIFWFEVDECLWRVQSLTGNYVVKTIDRQTDVSITKSAQNRHQSGTGAINQLFSSKIACTLKTLKNPNTLLTWPCHESM